MIGSFLSEWVKLRRPGMLLGGAGTIVGLAILTVVLSLTTASATPTDQEGPGGGVTLAQLAAADGLASVLAGAATVIGVVALSVFATSVASEYSQGTLRNLLVRQPRRVRLLAGKTLALAGFTTLAVLVAGIAAVATALILAPIQDVSTAAWFTSAGWTALAGGLGNLLVATLRWGLLGALLGLVLRAPPSRGRGRAGLGAPGGATGHRRLVRRCPLATRPAAGRPRPGRHHHGHLRLGRAAAGPLRGAGHRRRHHPVRPPRRRT